MESALEDMLEAEVEPAALEALLHESGGNPQIAMELVIEALRHQGFMLREGRMALREGPMAIPRSLYAWVQSKLDRLPQGQREFLEAAAACGEGFDASLLASVTGEQPLAVIELLDDAVRQHRLFLEEGEAYRFRCGVVQRVALQQMPRSQLEDFRERAQRARRQRRDRQGG
jgi:predicted ATPase